jgi:hypothetical protein
MQRLCKASLDDAQEFSFDLDRRTADLELIADKRDELRLMIEAALNNPFETPDLDWLADEVRRFALTCKGVRA